MQPGQPGQPGQQGGGNGGPGGVRDGFGGAWDGGWNGGYGSVWGGTWGARTTPFTDEEIRQYQREYEQRLAEAQDLRNELEREAYANLPQVALLQQQLFESIRQVEFGLRREVQGEASDRVFTSGADAVPTGFRSLVEEYYRKLAGKPLTPSQTQTPPPPPR
jgi:hypothetical protein